LDTRESADRVKTAKALLIVGLGVLVLGIPQLAGGLYGYFWIVPDERDLVSETAREMGLTEIPGLSFDSTARFFVLNILIGSVMVALGAVMTTIALSRLREMRENRPA
jgi:hypothetical protein